MSLTADPQRMVLALAEILAGAFDASGLRGFLVGEPLGASMLRAVPRRASREQLALAVASMYGESGISQSTLSRLASARPGAIADIAAFAVVLRDAGFLLPDPAAQVQALEGIPAPPTLIAGHRRMLNDVLDQLHDTKRHAVALLAHRISILDGLLGALLREPRLYEEAAGGVSLVAVRPEDDLLMLLRTHGLAIADSALAFAPDIREARSQLAQRIGEQSLLVVLDGGNPDLCEALVHALPPTCTVLVATTHRPLAVSVAGDGIVEVPEPGASLAQDLLMWWAWGADGAATTLQAIATALPSDPDVIELAGRVMAGPPPLLEPSELLAALVILQSRGGGAGSQALVDRILAALPADEGQRLLRLGIYGEHATLDRELVGAAWELPARAPLVRRELQNLAEFGLVRRRPDGRWMVPAVVVHGSRRWRERSGPAIRAAVLSATGVLVARLGAGVRAWNARDIEGLRSVVMVREAARALWREAFRWGRSDPRLRSVCATLATLPADFLAWFLPPDEALTWAEGALRSSTSATPEEVDAAQLRVARVSRELGRLVQAERLYVELRSRQGAHDPQMLLELGRILLSRGDLVSARVQLEDALSLAHNADDGPLEAEAAEALAEIHVLVEDRAAARTLLTRALGLVGPVAAVRARLRLRIGELFLEDGRIADATQQLLKAGRMAAAAEARLLEAGAARALAACARSEGRDEEAFTWLNQARRALEHGGTLADLVGVLRELAEVEGQRGRVVEAVRLHRRRAELLQASDDAAGAARALVDLGVLLEAQGCVDEALELLTASVRFARRAGDVRGEARGLLAAGRLFLLRDDLTTALIDLEAAAYLARDAGWTAGLAASLWRISRIERRIGQLAASLMHAREATALAEPLDAAGHFEVRVNLVEALEAFGQRGVAIVEAQSLLDGLSDGGRASRVRSLLASWGAEANHLVRAT